MKNNRGTSDVTHCSIHEDGYLEGTVTERMRVKLNGTDTDVWNGNDHGLLLRGGGDRGDNGAGKTRIKECVMKMVRGAV
jgi:hypothetical protein